MKKFILLVLLLIIFVPFLGYSAPKNDRKEVHIEFSKKELKFLEKLKKKKLDEMLHEAESGNPAALYLIGACYLSGLRGAPINVKIANQYFVASASLGFAPALDQLKFVYLEKQNPFLAIAYLNLVISFNHSEFSKIYHKLREDVVTKYGQEVANELERIVCQKKIKIIEIRQSYSESTNKKEFIQALLLSNDNIISEDEGLSLKHWERLHLVNK